MCKYGNIKNVHSVECNVNRGKYIRADTELTCDIRFSKNGVEYKRRENISHFVSEGSMSSISNDGDFMVELENGRCTIGNEVLACRD